MTWWIEHGDSLETLRQLPSQSADALVTDPPAGISFMGRSWDSDKGGREQWIAWLRGVLEECRRVMKPGTYGWVWALPRTSHWTATACEDAGFAVRDVLDEAFSMRSLIQPFMESLSEDQAKLLSRILEADQPSRLSYLFGTGFPKSRALLKPAVESWILIKAPGELRELRIDANRIAIEETDLAEMTGRSGESTPNQVYGSRIGQSGIWAPNKLGRWPANFAITHDDDCVQVGTRKVKTSDPRRADGTVHGGLGEGTGRYGGGTRQGIEGHGYGDADGTETVEAWQCVEGCPVAMLDAQSGVLRAGEHPAKRNAIVGPASMKGLGAYEGKSRIVLDSGGASRFFFTCSPLLLEHANPTLAAWNPELANTADNSSPRSESEIVSVLNRVVTVVSHEAVQLSGLSGLGMRGTPLITRRLCESVIETIQNIVKKCSPASLPARLSPRLSLVEHVENPSQIVITMTTTSPLKSDGFVVVVTLKSTKSSMEAGDQGSASRFIYVAKPSTAERSEGLPAGTRNVHTTVKSIALMRHLIGLIAAPGNLVLDPFTGSGTTGIAALRQGCRFAGIEKEAEYVEIARRRVAWAAAHLELGGTEAGRAKSQKQRRRQADEPTLFDLKKPVP